MPGVPGRGGPAPKRAEERRRRNKVDIDTVVLTDEVEIPPLLIEDAPQMVVDFYESLKRSGQARYYEPSDWERARLCCYMLTKLLRKENPSAMMYVALQRDFQDLLTTESDRRRLRMEIERGKAEEAADEERIAQMASYRRAATKTG